MFDACDRVSLNFVHEKNHCDNSSLLIAEFTFTVMFCKSLKF